MKSARVVSFGRNVTVSWTKFRTAMRIGLVMRRSLPHYALSAPARNSSARRNRALARIIVEAALDLAADPTGLDVFHQQWTGPVLGIGQALVQHLHHREEGIEADEVGELERAHRMGGAELHAGVDRFHVARALRERIHGLADT